MRYLFSLLLVFISLNANATQCVQKKHREFDFWLGHWQVSNSQNNTISTSQITLINDGCTILEEYSTPTGYQGKSLNIYDKPRQVWHQTWTDNTELLLQLEGQFNGQSMVLSGKSFNTKNQVIYNRVIWTPNTDGTVRQHWQISNDQGKNWRTAFDGLYVRAAQSK